MAVLVIIMALLIVGGDRTAPKVREFSWQGKQVGAVDNAFVLTFTRPMNEASVEDNFALQALVSDTKRENIPGKFSWSGRRMAYTLDAPAPYGYQFELSLDSAIDRFSANEDSATPLEPFQGSFRSRDRAFLYLGTKDEEDGRLILYNLTQNEKRILTPETLVVNDYEPYPQGDRVLFSATDRASYDQGLANQQLYIVATGIHFDAPLSPLGDSENSVSQDENDILPEDGEVRLILDNNHYQNLKFDLSPDGQTIVTYRVNRQNPADFGLWIISTDQDPRPLETEPGGDFLITPDSQAIAYLQGEGMAIFPLTSEEEIAEEADSEDTQQPLDFLPQYGMVLNFSPDGSALAAVQFNADPITPTRSLYLVTNRGDETELIETTGSILKAEFDPTGKFLYCLLTELIPGEVYTEKPYLTSINLETLEQVDLLLLPSQQDIQMNLAPDGLGLIFDQIISAQSSTGSSTLRANDGQPIASGQLWFFPILIGEDGNPIQTEPDIIGVEGIRPSWIP